MPSRMKLYWSERTKLLRSGKGSGTRGRPIDSPTSAATAPRLLSSEPRAVTLFSGKIGKGHVEIHVGDDRGLRHGRPKREIARAEQPLLLGGDEDEQHRALRLQPPRLVASGDVEQSGDPRGIVHRAVVEAVAIDRSADAEMVEMGGEDDMLGPQPLVAAGQPGDDVGRGDRAVARGDAGAQRRLHRRTRAAASKRRRGPRARRSCRPEPVNSFSARLGVEAGAEESVLDVAKRRIGEIHAGLAGLRHRARPGNLDRLGGGQREQAGRARLGEQSRPVAAGVGLERARNLRGAAADHDRDLALEVDSGEIVMAGLGHVEAVADEDQGRLDPLRADARRRGR